VVTIEKPGHQAGQKKRDKTAHIWVGVSDCCHGQHDQTNADTAAGHELTDFMTL